MHANTIGNKEIKAIDNLADQIRNVCFKAISHKNWVKCMRSGSWKVIIDMFHRAGLEYWRETKNSTRITFPDSKLSCPASQVAPGYKYSRIDKFMFDELPVGRGINIPETAYSILMQSKDDDHWLKYMQVFAECFLKKIDRNIFRNHIETIDQLIIIKRIIEKAKNIHTRHKLYLFHPDDDEFLDATSQENSLTIISGHIERLITLGHTPDPIHERLHIEDIPDIYEPEIIFYE